MSAVALEPASRYTHAELAAIFTAGYEGYFTPIALDEAAFRFMVTTFDDDLEASRVLLLDGEPAGICKLAIRAERRGLTDGRRIDRYPLLQPACENPVAIECPRTAGACADGPNNRTGLGIEHIEPSHTIRIVIAGCQQHYPGAILQLGDLWIAVAVSEAAIGKFPQ